MTLKKNRAPLLYYIKLCVTFQIHRWIQTKVTVWKRSIWVKMGDFFVLCDLEIWWMTLENNRAPLLYYIKLCASFHTHWWFLISVTVRAGVKYVLSNTNTKIWIFQIQIQIFCSTLIQIQIQIQIHRFKYKYKYKYVQPNMSSETVQIQNRAILWIPRYMLMACVSLCLGDTWR